jgi:uncharacterized protein with PIN domain
VTLPILRKRLAAPHPVQAVRWLPVEPEQSFQRRVIKAARLFGWQLIYFTYDSRHSPEGYPDLTLCKPPRLIFAELKRDDAPRRLPLAQEAWHDALCRCTGVEAYVWRPRDWQQIEKILRRH